MGLLDRVKTNAPGHGGATAESEHEKQTRRKKDSAMAALRTQVHERLVEELGEDILFGEVREDKTLKAIASVVEGVVEENGMVMHRSERERVIEELSHEILGLGPIEPLIRDPEINEVMVNGPFSVYVERNGRIEKTNIRFKDKTHVLRIIEKIVSPLGRRIDEASPMVDARLKDGSRVNAIIPPLSLTGPCLTIRKFSKDPMQVDDLIAFGTISREIATFLESCVKARLNIIVSGGTGSGKTTTLNVLSSFIPTDERIVTIEDAAELQLRQDHVIILESRPPNVEGKGHISIRDLVRNCLRMRPDRIVVGEVRGGEALDMLQAMNTGHDGSITTAHSNTPRDTLARIETMVLMAGMDLPLRAIREQICSALDLVVHQERLKDGTRRITHITEVLGMENTIITLQDIFKFESQGIDEDGRYIGKIKPTGIVPQFVERFKAAGIKMPLSVFCEV
jgi:pilus assembly protein CpaF